MSWQTSGEEQEPTKKPRDSIYKWTQNYKAELEAMIDEKRSRCVDRHRNNDHAES